MTLSCWHHPKKAGIDDRGTDTCGRKGWTGALHMGKTKVLPNQISWRGVSLTVRGKAIQIVEPTKYLRRVLTHTEMHDVEIEHGIGLAWKKFMSPKKA